MRMRTVRFGGTGVGMAGEGVVMACCFFARWGGGSEVAVVGALVNGGVLVTPLPRGGGVVRWPSPTKEWRGIRRFRRPGGPGGPGSSAAVPSLNGGVLAKAARKDGASYAVRCPNRWIAGCRWSTRTPAGWDGGRVPGRSRG